MNSQTPDQECLSDSYQTDKAKTMLNKRYEELRTQILELGSVGPLGVMEPLNSRPPRPPSSATQWWESGQIGEIGEEFNLITQQGMVSWLEVWLELKPMGDTDAHAHANTGKGYRNNRQPWQNVAEAKEKNIQPGQGQGPETRMKGNGEGGGTQDRGDMILDCPGALVGVLSDMICNTINVRPLTREV
jgi:hypothetical protein